MSRFVLSLIGTVLLPVSAVAQAETWQIDPAHAAAQFAVRHVGFPPFEAHSRRWAALFNTTQPTRPRLR